MYNLSVGVLTLEEERYEKALSFVILSLFIETSPKPNTSQWLRP